MVGLARYGYGDGYWDGSGYGSGSGSGYGYGAGSGAGSGHGYGYGDGYGYGYGDGYGDGDGYGYGDALSPIDDKPGGYKSWYSIKWGVLRIGCEVRSLGDWIANAEEIDRKHGDGIADQTQALAERLAASTNEEE